MPTTTYQSLAALTVELGGHAALRSSSLTRWRNRLGEAGAEELLALSKGDSGPEQTLQLEECLPGWAEP